ncbi:MAG: signal peptide peptidase SppA [Mesorhizobium amorphae]|nr:MAG: signal peptide peptidase SppA [Mesorhizobium amorphae]
MSRADTLLDRRRLRRKLAFWRVGAIVLVGLAVAAFSVWQWNGQWRAPVDHIAKVKIEGTITEDEELLERLERIGDADRVKGVIVSINSPGGTTVGGEAVFNAVRKLAEKKPVVAQVGGLAASAGYMIASATDGIVARQSSIVGSIGVIFPLPNVSGLLDRIGVQVDAVKSSPLKAEPSPFNPTTEEERAMLRAMVLDSYDWFVGLVESRRPLSRAEVLALADGSVFTGRQALERKLVDRLGGEEEAKAWLVEKGVSDSLEVVEWEPRRQTGLLWGSASSLLRLAGLPDDAAKLASSLGTERLFLDGLVSLWHPE